MHAQLSPQTTVFWITRSQPTSLFTGKERDSETGLDYFGARYYENTMVRFLSPDPENAGAEESNPQSWNAYSYALNNPLRFTDPSGEKPVSYTYCADIQGGKQECHTYSPAEWEEIMKHNGDSGVQLPDDRAHGGDVTCNGKKCGSVTVMDDGSVEPLGLGPMEGGFFAGRSIAQVGLKEFVRSEIRRTVGGGVKNIVAQNWRKLTRREAKTAAKELGFKPVKGAPFNSHGEPVFKKGTRYITPDRDGHHGGVWKMFDKNGNRLGTYDANLNKVAD